jgi:hypothetical protein
MDDANVKLQHPAFTLNFTTPPHDWTNDWRAFRQEHPGWRLAAESEPVYSLPGPAIRSLALPGGTTPALLDKDDAAAERALTKLCRPHYAVGCWEGRLVRYDLLRPAAASPESQLQLMGWTAQLQGEARRLVAGSKERRQRLKGCAGWLLTEPRFVRETQDLSDRWRALPADQRPSFPLSRVLPIGNTRPRPSPAIVAFGDKLRAFLDRWGLTLLATWDLPEPQGPLLPNSLPPGAAALPAHGVHLVLPLHYPLQGADEPLRQVLGYQRQAARDLGLDESLAGLPHHKAYASLFDVLHLERAIRARLRPGRLARGHVMRLEGAITEGLGVSLALVQKCRKAITACLKGRRSRVTWLLSRNRRAT